MAENLPAPLVPPEVDLRGMEYMPLKGDILFKSTTWLKGSHESRSASLRLWWHGFAHEVPAASLPDDDQLLAEYAGYGEIVKAWLRIKPLAMRGWVRCSDGRWYHKTVAELALEAWKGRVKNREKARRWRERKEGSGGGESGGAPHIQPGPVTPPNTGSVTVTEPLRNHLKGESEVKVKGELIKKDSTGAGAPAEAAPPDLPAVAADPQPAPPALVLEADDGMEPPLGLDRSPEGHAVRLWNEMAECVNAELGRREWPTVQKLTTARRKALRARLKDCGGIEGWKTALAKASKSRWLRGETPRSRGHEDWRFNLDTLVREQFFTKLMEAPDDDDPSRRTNGRSGTDAELAGIIAAGTGG